MRSSRFAALCLAAAMLTPSISVAEPKVIFVTRHAEKAKDGKDPDLSPQGQARAQNIGALLRKAGIRQIFSTTTARTQQTARPLATLTGLEVQSYDGGKPAAMIEKVKGLPGPTMIVGHSNTVPDLVKLLGGGAVPEIADEEFDRLYQVIIGDDGKVTILLLTSGS